MHAISMMRSPLRGSSPVVSVSRMISRMLRPRSGRRAAAFDSTVSCHCDQPANRPQAFATAQPGLDQEIGPPALLAVWHLPRFDARDPFLAHAGPAKQAAALHETR